jgi:GntR family transcriptional regulator
MILCHDTDDIASIAARLGMTCIEAGLPGIATVSCVYKIDLHSQEASYLQLAALLRADIKSGKIPARSALPSITQLTGETGLAVGTVRKSIAVLIDEGIAYTVPGRGTFAGKPSR